MADGDEKLITERKVDEVLAAHISDQVSLTRTALNNVLPKTQGVIAQAAQYTRQRPDSTWLNPVRDASVGGRIYVGTVDDRPPAYNDGLQVGDLWYPSRVSVSRSSCPPLAAPCGAPSRAAGAAVRHLSTLGLSTPARALPRTSRHHLRPCARSRCSQRKAPGQPRAARPWCRHSRTSTSQARRAPPPRGPRA